MATSLEDDPFSAAPSPYAADAQYLAGSYQGPERPRVLPLAAISFTLGAIALSLALLGGANAVIHFASAGLQTLAGIALPLGVFIGLGAIITGHIGFVRADRRGLRGRGYAAAGFVFGYIALALDFVALVLTSASNSLPGLI